nr:MAG TPA: Protein transport protein SEC61, Protein, Sec63, Sec71, Sec72, Sec66.68A [Caudoviricetes sp.]
MHYSYITPILYYSFTINTLYYTTLNKIFSREWYFPPNRRPLSIYFV